MRAVVLSDQEIQRKIGENLIPLKVVLEPGASALPLDWPGLERWQTSYKRLGGEDSQGFTCCVIISPDLETEYGGTGSAMVWELFDSIAYDREKFATMLDSALARAARENEIRNSPALSERRKAWQLQTFRRQTRREINAEGRFHLPPPGFTAEKAKELFRMTGDLP